MTNPSKSSPESPAKEQPVEQNAAPQDSPEICSSAQRQCGVEDSRGSGNPTEPAVAAPDAAAMMKRLQLSAEIWAGMPVTGLAITKLPPLVQLLIDASAMIEKLGQRIETLQAAHDLGWAHKECPNCGADMMTGAKLGQEWIHGAWDNDAISAMAGAALQSFPKIGYMENATKIVRAVLKTQEEYRSPPPPERP